MNRYRVALRVLLATALALVVLHLALPYMVRAYLNRQLADMGDYRGHVENVDLAWWRGAYRVEGLRVVKTGADVPVPFLDVPAIDLALSWRALWRDRVTVSRVVLERPALNLVDNREDPQARQSGAGTDWRAQLERLTPVMIDEIRIRDGRVHFRNFTSEPKVDLVADRVHADVRNLSNAADASGERFASLDGSARVFGHAALETTAAFDPLGDFEDFEFQMRLTGVKLPRVNEFARAYANLDFAAGTGDLVIEASADDGRLDGYVKPLLRNVDVFKWEQDVARQEQGFLSAAWEAVADAGESILKNRAVGQSATRVELSGTLRNTEVSGFQALLAALRNAFVDAFRPYYEQAE